MHQTASRNVTPNIDVWWFQNIESTSFETPSSQQKILIAILWTEGDFLSSRADWRSYCKQLSTYATFLWKVESETYRQHWCFAYKPSFSCRPAAGGTRQKLVLRDKFLEQSCCPTSIWTVSSCAGQYHRPLLGFMSPANTFHPYSRNVLPHAWNYVCREASLLPWGISWPTPYL